MKLYEIAEALNKIDAIIEEYADINHGEINPELMEILEGLEQEKSASVEVLDPTVVDRLPKHFVKVQKTVTNKRELLSYIEDGNEVDGVVVNRKNNLVMK